MIRQILAIFDFLCHVKIHKNKKPYQISVDKICQTGYNIVKILDSIKEGDSDVL